MLKFTYSRPKQPPLAALSSHTESNVQASPGELALPTTPPLFPFTF